MSTTKDDWLLPALKECMERIGCCGEDCKGYPHCIKEDKDIWEETVKMIERKAEALRLMVDAMTGATNVYLYFATHEPLDGDDLIEKGYIAHVNHGERRYIPLIDGMAYGTVIYDRQLEPWEIARMRLTSAPRE